MLVSDILHSAERLAPLDYALPGDPSGLQIGDSSRAAARVAVCLDASPAVLAEACARGAELVIAHHPLMYHPLTSLAGATPVERLIADFVRSGVAFAAYHTCWDVAPGGVNDVLADAFDLVDTRPLEITRREKLLKLVVFVPEEAIESVRLAIGEAGAGVIGCYSHCSFRSEGTGCFLPSAEAHPHIGAPGRPQEVQEWRLEAQVDEAALPRVLQAMRTAHPYEEPAVDLYELHAEGRPLGLGRIGTLAAPLPFADFSQRVANALGGPVLRCYGADAAPMVRTVALCGGSGGDLAAMARGRGADVYVTGEIRHHELLDAAAMGLAVIDGTHQATESPGMRQFAAQLAEDLGDQAEVFFVESAP